MRAVWLGAIVPGLGQIYNRSYWKIPIVYGGLMGCTYAIIWTNSQYNGYKNAYRDIYFDIRDGKVSNDPSKSYIAILPEGYTIDRMGVHLLIRVGSKNGKINHAVIATFPSLLQ